MSLKFASQHYKPAIHTDARQMQDQEVYDSKQSSASSLNGTKVSTPATEASDTSSSQASNSQTKAELEFLIYTLLQAVNNRDPLPFEGVLDKKFHAILAAPTKVTAEEYVAQLQIAGSRAPNQKFRILNLDTTIDQQRGSARMFMDFEMSGQFEGVTKQSVAEMKFRAGEDGKWRLLFYEAHDGAMGMAGF